MRGFVAQLHLRPSFPQPQTQLCHDHRLWRAQVGEAVEDGCTDVELGYLALKRSDHHLLPQAFETIHLRLHQ